jgi:hypothetical protein
MTCDLLRSLLKMSRQGFNMVPYTVLEINGATGFGPKDRHRLIAVLTVEQRKPHVQILTNIKIIFVLQLE